jgi:hypothetical protein
MKFVTAEIPSHEESGGGGFSQRCILNTGRERVQIQKRVIIKIIRDGWLKVMKYNNLFF